MSDFLDSNILVYAYDARYPEKKRIAEGLLRRAFASEFAISTQVLAEFTATLMQKFVPSPPSHDIVTILDNLAPIRVIAPDAEMVRRAVEAHAAYGIHFYDGMIIAAAERVGAQKILSEDLNPGQKYFNVEVVNPFREH